ncbi:MAG: hypothetical protein QT00_C0002G0088 [archaeon GW2011_AR5]|nr:MAG: hypothetical protein QT00_C0002G0088 [archaeon GW2011_AR5]
MHVTKIYEKDAGTRLVSDIFDNILVNGDFKFESIELHVRDKAVSFIDDEKAVICLDYNDPFIREMDARGIRILLVHELFRLTFKFDVPKHVEDVIIGREMLRRGYGDELLYLYYNRLLQGGYEGIEGCVRANLPWIIFSKHDKYDSELLKKQAAKICGKKFDCRRLFDVLVDLSQKTIPKAAEEYTKLVK